MTCLLYYVFFFFSSRRRHTRCGRDWSSDVCSSDLNLGGYSTLVTAVSPRLSILQGFPSHQSNVPGSRGLLADPGNRCQARSEERRVGKECRSRWSPYH